MADHDDEKPLDPAAERVRRKMVRFMAVNLSILFLAVMVVVAAVVYRAFLANRSADAPEPVAATTISPPAASGVLSLPSGADIVSQSLSANRLSLHVRQSGAEAILVFDLSTGQQVGRFDIRRAIP